MNESVNLLSRIHVRNPVKPLSKAEGRGKQFSMASAPFWWLAGWLGFLLETLAFMNGDLKDRF